MAAKIEVEKCEGCGECVDLCSVGAITMVDGKAVVKDEDCCECNVCVDECKTKAIAMA